VRIHLAQLLHEAFLNSSVLLLVGSLLDSPAGGRFSPGGIEKMLPFTDSSSTAS